MMAGLDDLGFMIAQAAVEQAELMSIDRNLAQSTYFEFADDKFVQLFRLKKDMVDEIIDKLSPFMVQSSRRSALDVEIKVLSVLRFFASGSYQLDIAENPYFPISQSSVSRSIHEVINAVHQCGLFDEKVKFPGSVQELNEIRQQFYNIYGFPGIIGCIDCTHVAIVPPKKDDPIYPEQIYVNRKGYHSINVQLICDSNLKITSVNAKYPGATHDSHICNSSNVFPVMQELHRRYPGRYYLLGDSGYALRPWLMTPISDAVVGTPEGDFNDCQMAARSTIERVNGVLKARFRCLLKHRVLHYAPVTASKIINTCVLYNMCIENNLNEVPPVDECEEFDGIFEPENNEGNTSADNLNTTLAEGRRIRYSIVRSHFS